MNFPFQIINQNQIDGAWDGTPRHIAPSTSIHMPATPDGPLIFAYRIEPGVNQMATLTLTKGDDVHPKVIVIQPGDKLPGVFVNNWEGKELCITNISHAEGTDIWMAAFGVMPETEYEELPLEETKGFSSGQRARLAAAPGMKQVIFQAKTDKLTLFAGISGSESEGNLQASVLATNAEENTDRETGTAKEAPPNYYSTTTATNSSYEIFNDEENGESPPLYLMNISPEAADADVFFRRL